MFSVVMPITRYSYLLDTHRKPTDDNDNIQRFFRIGWKSFQKYVEWDTFFVIISKKDILYFEKTAGSSLHHFTIIFEEDLLKYTISNKYTIQMMCKLLIANYVKTPYYLVIDDDIICLRKFSFKDIFVNSKTKKHIRYTPDNTYNENWWRSSAIALKIDYVKPKVLMSVTPQILITSQVKSLMKHLSSSYSDWEHVLMTMKPRWTEYTLYWLYIDRDRFYRRSKIPLSDNATNIWFKTKNLQESINTIFENKKQYFAVIQSNVPEHTIHRVENAVKNKLKK